MRVGQRTAKVALFVLAAVLVGGAQTQQGVARDEVVYMHHGERYAAWWESFVTGVDDATSTEEITRVFGGASPTAGNREHPPLMKTLYGVSKRLFHDRLGWLSPVTSYRLPAVAMNALLVVLVFGFVLARWGAAAAVVSAGFTLLMPRAFFHAGFAAFDGPVVTMWFATLVSYTKALRQRGWVGGVGVVFGLALATKHNAVLIPLVMAAHWGFVVVAQPSSHPKSLWGRLRRARVELWLGPVIVAPIVLVVVWPWLWLDPIAHIRDWLSFHWHHVHYNFEYLGTNYNAPRFPWHVPLVTTALTAPVVTLVAAAMGAFRLLRMRRRQATQTPEQPGFLLCLSAAVAVGPFLLGTTPIFGAEKHWAAAMPSLCILAGIGVTWAARLAVARAVDLGWLRGPSRLVVVAISGCALMAASAETWVAQPYALSHYNALAGGFSGGADLGMNRQFWGYAARGVLPWLNEHAPTDGTVRVYTHDASPAWSTYRRQGLLRANLIDAGLEEHGVASSQFAMVIHEKHFMRHDIMIWRHYRTLKPAFVLTAGGVPIVSVYAREPTP